MFGKDIRAIVPQIAMSAGTMMACACREIVMGKQSNLGPIDPQMNGIPATGVLREFEQAINEIKDDPARIAVWQVIIGKYHPSFLQQCKNAIDWSKTVVEDWLRTGMFEGDRRAAAKAAYIVKALTDDDAMKNHGRHVHIDQCRALKLRIIDLEADQKLQDLVLTTHHAFMQTLGEAGHVTKIVENHRGVALISAHNPGAQMVRA